MSKKLMICIERTDMTYCFASRIPDSVSLNFPLLPGGVSRREKQYYNNGYQRKQNNLTCRGPNILIMSSNLGALFTVNWDMLGCCLEKNKDMSKILKTKLYNFPTTAATSSKFCCSCREEISVANSKAKHIALYNLGAKAANYTYGLRIVDFLYLLAFDSLKFQFFEHYPPIYCI